MLRNVIECVPIRICLSFGKTPKSQRRELTCVFASFSFLLSSVALLLICVQPVMAQRGKLIVRVNPRETYIYADGKPVVEAKGHYVILPAGEHKIDLYNYGYKPESRNVTIEAHKTTVIDVTMQAIPGTVSGPWGCITLEGARAPRCC